MFVNISGPIVADTVYSDGKLVARDVSFTLPEIVPMSVDVTVMGTFSMPVWALIEHMEASITKIGVDKGLRALIKPGMKPLELRWVQTETSATGATRNVGCKAFLRGINANIPEIGGEIGSQSEHETKIALTRYNLFADGEEMWNIDRLAGKCRIAGQEMADFGSML